MQNWNNVNWKNTEHALLKQTDYYVLLLFEPLLVYEYYLSIYTNASAKARKNCTQIYENKILLTGFNRKNSSGQNSPCQRNRKLVPDLDLIPYPLSMNWK